jgi:hypothetical protein
LSEAASILSSQPAGVQLRYLQTLTEIAVEKNSTIVFPVPVEMLQALFSNMTSKGSNSGDGAQ